VSQWSRLVGAIRGNRLNAEIDEELEAHVHDAVAAGRDPEEARRALGSRLRYREEGRDARVVVWLADLVQDLRFGGRMLLRSPGFSSLAILCLTLGIGANAAVFSWIEGILLRPYPLVVEQNRLFAVTGTDRGAPGHTDVSWPDWLDLQRHSTLIDAFVAEKSTGSTLTIGDRAERASGSMVSANYFDAIGVRPLLGRGFEPGEDTGRNAHPVTVISYQMWQDRFRGDPDIIGKTQVLNGLPHTIVGVAPKGFFGTFVGYAFQFWVPASMQAQFDAGIYKLEDRGARWIEGYVRLKQGVTIQQAQAELSAVAARLEQDYPGTNRGRGIRLFPLWQTPFNNAGALLPTLGIALVVVLSVLLIACANVGNLLLVRAFARHQEMTIRLSVGAGRARLVKQLVTEGLVLSVLAAAGGLIVANWLRNALALLTPARGGVLLRLPGELDWRVLAMSATVCVAATLLFALVPAVLTSNIDLAGALRSESGGVVGVRGRAWVRSTLVLVQMSLSFVLLVGAGLLIQSLQAVRSASPGFSTPGVLTTGVDLFTAGYDAQRAKNFRRDLDRAFDACTGSDSDHPRPIDKAIGKPPRIRQVGQAAPHQPLDGNDGVLRIVRLMRHRGEADVDAIVAVAHDRRHQRAPVLVGQHHCKAAPHRRHKRVGGAEVDADRTPARVRNRRFAGLGDLEKRHQSSSSPCMASRSSSSLDRNLSSRTGINAASYACSPSSACASIVSISAASARTASLMAASARESRASTAASASSRRSSWRSRKSSGRRVSVSAIASIPCSSRRYCARRTGSLSAR